MGQRLIDAASADLFAGSGIFSFEAVSRGASSALAVDASRRNLSAISKLAETFGVAIDTMAADVVEGFSAGRTLDVVYADPPYDFGRYDDLLRVLDSLDLSDDAVVAVEHRRHTSPFTVQPRRLVFSRRAEYGEVWMSFFTAAKAPGLQ